MESEKSLDNERKERERAKINKEIKREVTTYFTETQVISRKHYH